MNNTSNPQHHRSAIKNDSPVTDLLLSQVTSKTYMKGKVADQVGNEESKRDQPTVPHIKVEEELEPPACSEKAQRQHPQIAFGLMTRNFTTDEIRPATCTAQEQQCTQWHQHAWCTTTQTRQHMHMNLHTSTSHANAHPRAYANVGACTNVECKSIRHTVCLPAVRTETFTVSLHSIIRFG